MQPTLELINDIYRDRVRSARRTQPREKLLDGPRLFDWACSITAAGIHHQFPDADDRRVAQILRERLAMRQQLEGVT